MYHGESEAPTQFAGAIRGNADMAARENSRALLARMIAKLHRQAHELQNLLDVLPYDLSPAADEGLYQLLMKAQR